MTDSPGLERRKEDEWRFCVMPQKRSVDASDNDAMGGIEWLVRFAEQKSGGQGEKKETGKHEVFPRGRTKAQATKVLPWES
jgi:hypothetical protein